MVQILLYALTAIFVGALFPLQAAVNATLGRGVGGPVAATLISFGAGFLCLCAINAVAFRQWPSAAALAAQPPAMLVLGGALGATYLGANVFLQPRLGAASTLAFVIAGQLAGALLLDRAGLFGLAVRDLSAGRIAGVVLVLVGVVLVRLT
jgi:transporter family-2 protein